MTRTGAVLMTADAVAAQVASRATISFPGNASMLVADHLLAAIEARFLGEQAPADITVLQPCFAALSDETGVSRLARPGLLKRFITSSLPSRYGDGSKIGRMIRDNAIEAYNLPMGVMYTMIREAGAGRPGVLSEVGVGTLVDPANGGGRLNAVSRDILVRAMRVGERDFLFYPSQRIDVALLKATTADEDGNLSMEREPLTLGVLPLAIAAKASGGKVFAQVERIVKRGSLHPKSVKVPATLLDGFVLAPDAAQSGASRYDPAHSNEIAVAFPPPPPVSAAEHVIMARAASALKPGWLINVGVGLGAQMPALVRAADRLGAVTVSTEHGSFGGWPTLPPSFGAHLNAECLVEPSDMFNLYTGGGLDACFLGMAECDAAGNINVSQFGGRTPGAGGFIDISARTPNVFICANFAGGGRIEIRDGAMHVREIGRARKFVSSTASITLSGRVALERGQTVLLITERGAFRLTPDGWLLIEIAPGVDPMRDMKPMMDFPLRIADDLAVYSREIMAGPGAAFDAWLAGRLDG